MASGSYADRQDRRITPGFALVVALSIAATALMLIFALAYYSRSPARLSSNYAALAAPADQALAAQIDAYNKDLGHNLTAAKSDLMNEAQTEASFDDQLSAVGFPAAAETAEGALLQADQARTKLIEMQAHASSFAQMQSLNSRVQAANAAVETQVKLIRQDLHLPPANPQMY